MYLIVITCYFPRIRGVAWTCRVSPAVASQTMHGAKQLLNSFLSDVYINFDQRKVGVVYCCFSSQCCLYAIHRISTEFMSVKIIRHLL